MSWLPLTVLEKYRYVPSSVVTSDGLNSAPVVFGPVPVLGASEMPRLPPADSGIAANDVDVAASRARRCTSPGRGRSDTNSR